MIDEDKLKEMNFGDMSDELSKAIQQAIDNEIMEALKKVALGWTPSNLPRRYAANEGLIINWLDENIKSKYEVLGNRIYFEDKNDAMLFQLKWS